VTPPSTPPLPTVSVVIPCHDAAAFLAMAIDSVLAQDPPPLEVIVVDDASTDGSVDVARGYGGRVRVIASERNRGPAATRNAGAAAASGAAILFLDADDEVAPGTLAALAAALAERPGGIAACPWNRLRLRDGRWTRVPAGRAYMRPEADPLREWLEGAWVPTCALLWSREAYTCSGGWNEALWQNEDGDIAIRAFTRGVGVTVAGGGEGLYRTHGDERLTVSTDVFSARRIDSQRSVMDGLRAALEAQGRLGAYAEPIGLAYHRIAVTAFRSGFPAIGRDCLAKGHELAGERAVSRTRAGRLLGRVLGVERKERVAAALARFGIATGPQRRLQRLRALGGGSS
jgi:O-antigen biosynthesis protein